jgi:hypothetical protein
MQTKTKLQILTLSLISLLGSHQTAQAGGDMGGIGSIGDTIALTLLPTYITVWMTDPPQKRLNVEQVVNNYLSHYLANPSHVDAQTQSDLDGVRVALLKDTKFTASIHSQGLDAGKMSDAQFAYVLVTSINQAKSK